MDTRITSLLPKLEKAFSEFEEVVAVYIYGSRARGNARTSSDWDFAIFLEKPFADPYDLVRLQERIEGIVGGKVDLLVLNSARVALAFKAIKEGVLVYGKNPDFRSDFEVMIMKKYFDVKQLIEEKWRKPLG